MSETCAREATLVEQIVTQTFNKTEKVVWVFDSSTYAVLVPFMFLERKYIHSICVYIFQNGSKITEMLCDCCMKYVPRSYLLA